MGCNLSGTSRRMHLLRAVQRSHRQYRKHMGFMLMVRDSPIIYKWTQQKMVCFFLVLKEPTISWMPFRWHGWLGLRNPVFMENRWLSAWNHTQCWESLRLLRCPHRVWDCVSGSICDLPSYRMFIPVWTGEQEAGADGGMLSVSCWELWGQMTC